MKDIPWTKDQLLDHLGRPLTQSLFLEMGYQTRWAIFTLNDEDKVYKDKTYFSLKKWFLEIEDPLEILFAKQCLLGWSHWQRMNENKQLKPHFQEWRDELEVTLRANAVQRILDMTGSENGNFNASKWIADRGYEKRGAGRPSKRDKEDEVAIQDRIQQELKDNIARMEDYKHA